MKWIAMAAGVLGLLASACVPPQRMSYGVPRGGQPAVQYPPLAPFYLVTVVDAAIDTRRPDGSPWHTKRADKTWTVIGGLAGAAIGLPELSIVGGWVDGDDQTFGPAPLVEIDLAGVRHATTARPSTFQPRWDEPLLFDLRRIDPSEVAVIAVRDGYDGSVIASTRMPIGELVGRAGHTLSELRGVPALNVAVRAVTPAQNVAREVTVRAELGAELDVVGGDLIAIAASGAACVKPGLCFGPNGDGSGDEYRRRYNRSGYSDAAHGALVGELDGVPVRVGAAALFQVPHDGTLRLFVNDADPANNTGSFAVRVIANPHLSSPTAPIDDSLPAEVIPESDDAAPVTSQDALRELRDLTDEMCACTDRACAEHVTEEMMALGERHKDTRATEADMAAARALTEEITRCMSRVMGTEVESP